MPPLGSPVASIGQWYLSHAVVRPDNVAETGFSDSPITVDDAEPARGGEDIEGPVNTVALEPNRYQGNFGAIALIIRKSGAVAGGRLLQAV